MNDCKHENRIAYHGPPGLNEERCVDCLVILAGPNDKGVPYRQVFFRTRVYRVIPGACPDSTWKDRTSPPDGWSGYPRTCVDNAYPAVEWHPTLDSAQVEASRIGKVYSCRQPGYQRDDPLPVHVFSCWINGLMDALNGKGSDYQLELEYVHRAAPGGDA